MIPYPSTDDYKYSMNSAQMIIILWIISNVHMLDESLIMERRPNVYQVVSWLVRITRLTSSWSRWTVSDEQSLNLKKKLI